VDRTDSLVATLRGVTLAYRSEGGADERLSAIGAVLEPVADRILEQCEAHEATSGRNHLPFLTRFYSNQISIRRRHEMGSLAQNLTSEYHIRYGGYGGTVITSFPTST